MANPGRRFGPRDRRGVTSILNYALLLVIVTLLVTGLLVGVSQVVESQHERAIRSQLDTVGNHVAADVGTANRLVESVGGDRVRLRTRLPDTVGGSHYRIGTTNAGGDRYRIVLRSSDPVVRTTVVVRSPVPLTGNVSGGDVILRYDNESDQLVVTDG